jgi:hypothetical protein
LPTLTAPYLTLPAVEMTSNVLVSLVHGVEPVYSNAFGNEQFRDALINAATQRRSIPATNDPKG